MRSSGPGARTSARSERSVGLGVHQPYQFLDAQLDPPPISQPGPAQRRRLDVVDSLVVLANLVGVGRTLTL
ncbi:hypothetical protein [Streptomyces cylindrosporus]|uniref:Transposase n=1 Tax=Streptomyces cylindrosporus TaxID=2927583 RepID=A0ABS9Y0B8_9ACTN|nr:hypothetical protein [Streptomyces cylindrosporus]MCI3270624.1 hypothetical protein [Streptomyces cylindrosporus]